MGEEDKVVSVGVEQYTPVSHPLVTMCQCILVECPTPHTFGRVEHYLKHYIEDRLADDSSIDFKRVFVTHSPSEEGMVSYAIEKIKSYGLFREVLETTAGCTICCHCGPDTLGILFMRKNKE